MSTTTEPYVYFVAYTYPRGTGMAEVIRTSPITGWNDILDTMQMLRDSKRLDWVNLTGYQLMSGPDTCTTCGSHNTTGQEVAK